MDLDVAYLRAQFPQLHDDPDLVFCSNAGGSFVASPVLDIFSHYNRHMRVQPYAGYAVSNQAGQAMDEARSGWSRALNIHPDELTIGPSTSLNSYVMAQALARNWGPGDEIIVTQQDHESNHGVWRYAAEAAGVTLKEWPIDPVTGLLDPQILYPLLTDKTRWVFFTHCSNVVGTVNPVPEIARLIRANSPARICVDGVAYAPHHIPDLAALDVDMYLFSLYKVFGPHQGIMYLRRDLQGELPPQSHFFLHQDSHKRFNPAGPQHAQVAACRGVLDYFQDLYVHHQGPESATPSARLQWLHTKIAAHEQKLAAALLDFLEPRSDTRVLGKPHVRDGDRSTTIAFKPLKKSAGEVAKAMQGAGIGTEHGHFYAYRALSHMGIKPEDGVVRISLVHYNSIADVERILSALERTLG